MWLSPVETGSSSFSYMVLETVFGRSRRADFESQLGKRKLGHTHCGPGRIVAGQALILHFRELPHLSTHIDVKSSQLDDILQGRAGCGQGSLETLEGGGVPAQHSAGSSESVVDADL